MTDRRSLLLTLLVLAGHACWGTSALGQTEAAFWPSRGADAAPKVADGAPESTTVVAEPRGPSSVTPGLKKRSIDWPTTLTSSKMLKISNRSCAFKRLPKKICL